jgi:hypothetical protein
MVRRFFKGPHNPRKCLRAGSPHARTGFPNETQTELPKIGRCLFCKHPFAVLDEEKNKEKSDNEETNRNHSDEVKSKIIFRTIACGARY